MRNALIDAFEPIYWFTKIFGFYVPRYRVNSIIEPIEHSVKTQSETKRKNKTEKSNLILQERRKFPFSIASLIHVCIVLTINVCILYHFGDPRPFLRATNIPIINYGLWLLIECNMALSEWMTIFSLVHFSIGPIQPKYSIVCVAAILFVIINMALYRCTWHLWSKYERIDRELKLKFGVYIPYGIVAKYEQTSFGIRRWRVTFHRTEIIYFHLIFPQFAFLYAVRIACTILVWMQTYRHWTGHCDCWSCRGIIGWVLEIVSHTIATVAHHTLCIHLHCERERERCVGYVHLFVSVFNTTVWLCEYDFGAIVVQRTTIWCIWICE